MTLSGLNLNAGAIQFHSRRALQVSSCQVNDAENAFWAVVCARLRSLNCVPSVLKRRQYASTPWKFSPQESCFSSVALVPSRPVQSTCDELSACVPLALNKPPHWWWCAIYQDSWP